MYFLKYIKFLLTASNQHGVHSPFVYAFVTKCLYKKKKYCPKKVLNSVLKSIAYFNIKEINLRNKNTLLEKLLSINFPEVFINENSTDFIFFDILDKNTFVFIENNSDINNETIVFINHIFKTKKDWQSLIKNQKITVSIDMFYGGVLFFRKEQVKQHFKIRI